MLILQRKLNEKIAIGDDIVIEVKAIRGGRVRLAITAPKTTSVHRMEIYDAINGNATPPDDCSLAIAIAGVISRAAEGGAE